MSKRAPTIRKQITQILNDYPENTTTLGFVCRSVYGKTFQAAKRVLLKMESDGKASASISPVDGYTVYSLKTEN